MVRLLAPLIALLLILPTAAHAAFTPAGAIVVDSTADTGDRCDSPTATECTLRGAIATANARAGEDTITFTFIGPAKFTPATPLPAITETVTIDGRGQANGPRIEIDGSLIKEDTTPTPAAQGAIAEPLDKPKAKATRSSDTGVIHFLRPWGLELRNADDSTIKGLIVHSFPYAQIGLDGTDAANVQGNWLGIKPDGSVPSRKSTQDRQLGLSLINSAMNVVGGIGVDKNVISGNEIGLVLMDQGASHNLIFGNYVGTSIDGRDRRPNTETGILLTLPTTLAGRGTQENRITGNVVVSDRKESYGISVLEAKKTELLGNFVGVSAAGIPESSTGEPLGHAIGIYVHDSPDTVIGGTGPAEFNVVSGNAMGIEVNGGSDRSKIAGNRIGTTYDGKTAAANVSGVAIVGDGLDEAPGDIVVDANTIAGSPDFGMYVTGGAQRPTLTNNRIGTDVDGVTRLPNRIGFATGAPGSGGAAPTDLTFGPGNVVSANRIDGVQMFGPGAVVKGNRIGVSADAKPLGNGTVGINVQGDGVIVENNTVSANAQGIAVNGPTENVHIRANRIGTAPSGQPDAEDFGNAGTGVLVLGTAKNTRIGGSSSNDANVISGNGRGVQVQGDAADTAIRQNVIGLDNTATNAIPNDVGVSLAGGTGTVVGGALGIDARNYIARNLDAGIRINGAKQSVIMGNYITDNRGPGVLADARGGDAVIGYDAETDGQVEDIDCRETRCNRIENNQGAGVRVAVPSQITVRGNRMRGNSGLDVDLGGEGATANDESDADDWANTPVGVAPIKATGDQPARIGGRLDRFDAQNTQIDVYGFSSTQQLQGRPRGGEHLGTAFPDARGQWALETAKPYAAYGAVMTDRHGNTGEMSPICTGDQDGDALCDNWETGGIDYDADGAPDLRLQDQGANPAKPDVFVEVDWQRGRKPHMSALYAVKEAFELAPQPINLHTAMGEQVPGDAPIDADGRNPLGRWDDVNDFLRGLNDDDPCQGWFGSADDRDDEQCYAILGARKLAYRYAIFAGKEAGGHAGAADPGRDAFLVALGNFPREDIMLGGGSGEDGCNRQFDACVAQLEAAVFMHELGHTLGLVHGGDKTGENNEPNYLSVMNYWYLTKVPLNSRPLDFSRKTPLARNEAAFDEGLPLYDDYPQRTEKPWTEAAITTYDVQKDKCRVQRVALGQTIDLDGDGQFETRKMGLNDIDLDNDPNGPEDCQKAENQTWLTGIDDWSRLRHSRHGLVGWDEGEYGDAETRSVPKASELAAAVDTDGDGIDDDEDVCPAAADAGQEDADKDGLGDACLPFITQRDVSLTLTAASANVPVGETRTVELEVANAYPKPATGVAVAITPPAGLTVDTPRWEVGEIPVRGSKKLTLTVTGTAAGRGELKAEVVAAAEPDFDSTPGNADADEDDQAAKRLTVFEPGAVRTASVRTGAAREGDEGVETTHVRIDVSGHSGISIEARLRSVGGTATPGVDYEPVDAPITVIPFTSEASVELELLSDTLDETDETIEFELSGVDGAQPETVRGTVTIRDDDDPRKPGELAYLGCVSRDYGAGGSCGQREPKLAAPVGEKALTPDGRFLWVADARTIVRLTRDPATGALGDAKCWVMTGPAGDCATLGDLDITPSGVHLTPDGKQLIVTGVTYDDGSPIMSMISLALDANGEPALTGCVGSGAPGCDTSLRADSAIISPGGRFLITVPAGQQRTHGEIRVYPLSNGKLEPSVRCYAHPDENEPCEPLTIALAGTPWTSFSPDGKTLALRTRDHLALLGWDETTGTLTQDGGCVRDAGRCRPATECSLNSSNEFVCDTPPIHLDGWGPVRFAPDGRALYVAAQRGNRVSALPRVADRTWSFDAATCVGTAATGCAVTADVVSKATEIITSPDGGDVYVMGLESGVLSLGADRVTGALSAPRCTMAWTGTGSCPAASGGGSVPQSARGNMVLDPTGRDLYTTDELPGLNYGIGRFLRTSRPPGGGNRAPLCSNADAASNPGATVELTLRCADPDGDPVTLRLTRGGGELTGTRLRYTAGTTAGVETIGFRASDGGLESAEAEVRVVVGNPPACADGAVSVLRRGSVALPMRCDRGTIEVVEHPAHGGVVGTTFNASPAGHDGVEYVKYASYDPDTGVRSNVATITVTVLAPPPGPENVEFGTVSLENDRGGSNQGCSGSSCRPNDRGDLPFPMRCNGSPTRTPGSCSGSLEACSPSGCSRRAGGTRASAAAAAKLKGSLGKAKFSIPVGQAKTVKLRLNAKARKELKRGPLKLKVVTTVKLPTGKTVTSTRTLTVKQPPAKKKAKR